MRLPFIPGTHFIPRELARSIRPRFQRLSTSAPNPVNLNYEKLTTSEGAQQRGPLVILHGLFGSKRNWGSLAKAFCRELNRPIYTLDLRNHGSSPHVEPMTYSHMAADVLHFCQTHSLSDISLLGHSMGGKVAMALALSPDLPGDMLSDLIVADIAPAKGDLSPEFRGYIDGMKEIQDTKVSSRKEAQEILSHYEKDPGVRTFLLTNFIPPSSDNPYAKFRVPLDILSDAIPEIGSFPYQPGERNWDGKALFIKGTKSRFINRHNLPIAEKFFPNMTLETLETGHWVHAERPNEFKKLVADFINPSP